MAADESASVLTARPVLAALEQRGVDAEPTLRAASLSRDALAKIENRLSFRSVCALWEAAAEATGDRSFGVHVAETLPTGAYDLFDYLNSSSTTVGEGLSRLTHYIRLIHDRSNTHLVVEPQSARVVKRMQVATPQYNEFSLTLLLLRSRRATVTEWKPDRVSFQHERPLDDGELSRVLGCPIVFGAAEMELRFPVSVLQLPHTQGDSKLLSILSRYADSLLDSLPPHGGLLERVSSSIARQMAHGLPTLATTSAAVRVPERTLQRRLAAEGVTHSALIDDVRRNLALKYLGHAGISIGEIAYLLHFSPTAFYRAFKRWTGESPLQYRTRLS
ncbi:MAG TPA: AraC family transcriptional regulator ligand-binding domain-containing protein [Myxococcales bacterium]|nr:AraC family transcriptional regulator ligand-binding domain-containing protein [Myxococcales bacterium]